MMNRAQHLKKDENCADQREWARERGAALHRAYKNTRRNGERRRQHASEQQGGPPRKGKPGSCPGQDAEKLPFLALGHPLKHNGIVPQKPRACTVFTARRGHTQPPDSFEPEAREFVFRLSDNNRAPSPGGGR